MPIDFIAFTSDRRLSGRIMLADDRLSDMLNAVPRLVVRDAQVDELITTGVLRRVLAFTELKSSNSMIEA